MSDRTNGAASVGARPQRGDGPARPSMPPRPRIGIPAMSSARVQGLRYAGSVVADAVVAAVVRAGGEPLIVSPRDADHDWTAYDGILVPGGSDIAPERYGGAAGELVRPADDDEQDDADARAIAAALEHGIPALLVCRGMQLLNVERGGTLHAHLDAAAAHIGTVHDVTVDPRSELARALALVLEGRQGEEARLSVSSYHHQGVDRVGEGLRVVARSDDGVVEALEAVDAERARLVAVQWHPEDRADSAPADRALFEWLVAAARERRESARGGAGREPAPRDGAGPRRLTPADVLPARRPPADDPVRVAVIAQLELPGQTAEVVSLIRRFTRTALDSLVDAGAEVELVDVTDEAEPDAERIASADGVLVLGGGDVDASLYGHAGAVPGEWGVDRRSDDRSIAVIRRAVDEDTPLFGICRGSQLLNVALGGTLVPDIVDGALHHGVAGEPMFLDESVTVTRGSLVHSILGRERVRVRSGHHQASAVPGAGLVVSARADDGVVEAIEHPGRRFTVGLQWHPEDDDGDAADRRRVFGAFVSAARAARASRRARGLVPAGAARAAVLETGG